ncbi:putative transcriptional regulator [Thioflavicoccus mobilis 8321]|uniref:Putative transcriptional regulator n=1 Tax=Thioflavicoccus mobilis 8321 TaxID=765912 RepID=L0GTK1_9GAMM|nr:transcriptional regulator [Thioflavicoccus mobilis]AGA90078.1 putative transcriptional regulator [Thioflavicoccus mobilis 8321]
MDTLTRISDLCRILEARRRPISLQDLMGQLECSESTARRAIHKLRDEFNAPIVFDQNAKGWYLDRTCNARTFRLPGHWLTAAELHALLSCHQLLRQIEPGLLGPEIAPLMEHIETTLAKHGLDRALLAERVRLVAIGARPVPSETLKAVAEALLSGHRLQVTYHSRSRDEIRERTLSLQRLTWYRSNWYLEAWCHQSGGPRRFAVERLLSARPLATAAEPIPTADLDAHFADAYGIFAGLATQTATLLFSRERARWVADERWHPHQRGRHLPDGRYELTLPYGRADELIMDILKYGPDVEVIAPTELRDAVAGRLEEAAKRYRRHLVRF